MDAINEGSRKCNEYRDKCFWQSTKCDEAANSFNSPVGKNRASPRRARHNARIAIPNATSLTSGDNNAFDISRS